jgi:hypothetical protein
MMMSSVAIATPENIMPSVTLVISIYLTSLVLAILDLD